MIYSMKMLNRKMITVVNLASLVENYRLVHMFLAINN